MAFHSQSLQKFVCIKTTFSISNFSPYPAKNKTDDTVEYMFIKYSPVTSMDLVYKPHLNFHNRGEKPPCSLSHPYLNHFFLLTETRFKF